MNKTYRVWEINHAEKKIEDPLTYARMTCSLGELILVASDQGLAAILLPVKDGDSVSARLIRTFPEATFQEGSPILSKAIRQLQDYFAGTRQTFDLPLDVRGTDFQKQVWRALGQIPFGGTRTYSDIARQIGRPKACRAVGAANRANPVPIVIPCHRIIGSDGSLTGYAGGLDIKQILLNLERK